MANATEILTKIKEVLGLSTEKVENNDVLTPEVSTELEKQEEKVEELVDQPTETQPTDIPVDEEQPKEDDEISKIKSELEELKMKYEEMMMILNEIVGKKDEQVQEMSKVIEDLSNEPINEPIVSFEKQEKQKLTYYEVIKKQLYK